MFLFTRSLKALVDKSYKQAFGTERMGLGGLQCKVRQLHIIRYGTVIVLIKGFKAAYDW